MSRTRSLDEWREYPSRSVLRPDGLVLPVVEVDTRDVLTGAVDPGVPGSVEEVV